MIEAGRMAIFRVNGRNEELLKNRYGLQTVEYYNGQKVEIKRVVPGTEFGGHAIAFIKRNDSDPFPFGMWVSENDLQILTNQGEQTHLF
jgi:hypothetical protein